MSAARDGVAASNEASTSGAGSMASSTMGSVGSKAKYSDQFEGEGSVSVSVEGVLGGAAGSGATTSSSLKSVDSCKVCFAG